MRGMRESLARQATEMLCRIVTHRLFQEKSPPHFGEGISRMRKIQAKVSFRDHKPCLYVRPRRSSP